MDNIGDRFHQLTKHVRAAMSGRPLDWARKPPGHKEYPEAPSYPLPPPSVRTSTVDEALRNRRSVRRFAPGAMAIEDLSYLLWAATGVREQRSGKAFRTSPSAGALYPIETYVLANSVAGVPPGIYHYCISVHRLERLRAGELGEQAAAAALDQEMCARAPAALIHTAVFERTLWKYGQRGYRYVYLDCAHIAANMAIAASSLGLGSCQIAAIYDDEMNELLGVDGIGESVVYMSAVGRPAEDE